MKNINISFPECLVFPDRIRGDRKGRMGRGDSYGDYKNERSSL